MMYWLLTFAIEVFYWFEQKSGRLWLYICGDNRVSCWFDPVPAFFTRWRYKAQNARVKTAGFRKRNPWWGNS